MFHNLIKAHNLKAEEDDSDDSEDEEDVTFDGGIAERYAYILHTYPLNVLFFLYTL